MPEFDRVNHLQHHEYPPMLGPFEQMPAGSAQWAEAFGLRIKLAVEHVETWGMAQLEQLLMDAFKAKPEPWAVFPPPPDQPFRLPDRFFAYMCGVRCTNLLLLVQGHLGPDHKLVNRLRVATAEADKAHRRMSATGIVRLDVHRQDTDLARLTEAARVAETAMDVALSLDPVEARRACVLAYGNALWALRKRFSAKVKFNEHVKATGLDKRDSAFRSNAIWLAKNWVVLVPKLNRCPDANPTNIRNWLRDKQKDPQQKPSFSSIIKPTDNWNFNPVRYGRIDGEEEDHGYIPGDIYVNCLWCWSKPNDIVAAPMAGGGQIMRVYEERAEWMKPENEAWELDLRMFDLKPRGRYKKQIIENDLTKSLPVEHADYIIIDLPYLEIVNGRYSDSPNDLANMPVEAWAAAVANIAGVCRSTQSSGDLCTIVATNYRHPHGHLIIATEIVKDAFREVGYRLHDLAYAARHIQQTQSPVMALANIAAKRNRAMLTDMAEVMTFRAEIAND